MDGWTVMAAPLELVVRVAVPCGALYGLHWLWQHVAHGLWWPDRVPDDDVVAAYLFVLDAGWPPRAPSTFAEVAVRVGTSVPHVRAVIGSDDLAV